MSYFTTKQIHIKKIKNGFGVVLDDLLAGVYVIITIALFGHFFGPPFE